MTAKEVSLSSAPSTDIGVITFGGAMVAHWFGFLSTSNDIGDAEAAYRADQFARWSGPSHYIVAGNYFLGYGCAWFVVGNAEPRPLNPIQQTPNKPRNSFFIGRGGEFKTYCVVSAVAWSAAAGYLTRVSRKWAATRAALGSYENAEGPSDVTPLTIR